MNVLKVAQPKQPFFLKDLLHIMTGHDRALSLEEVKEMGVDVDKYLNKQYDLSQYDDDDRARVELVREFYEVEKDSLDAYAVAYARTLVYRPETRTFFKTRNDYLYLAKPKLAYDAYSTESFPYMRLSNFYGISSGSLSLSPRGTNQLVIQHDIYDKPLITLGFDDKAHEVTVDFPPDLTLTTTGLHFINYILRILVTHAQCVCVKVGSSYELLTV